jgi:hypothetical protein
MTPLHSRVGILCPAGVVFLSDTNIIYRNHVGHQYAEVNASNIFKASISYKTIEVQTNRKLLRNRSVQHHALGTKTWKHIIDNMNNTTHTTTYEKWCRTRLLLKGSSCCAPGCICLYPYFQKEHCYSNSWHWLHIVFSLIEYYELLHA